MASQSRPTFLFIPHVLKPTPQVYIVSLTYPQSPLEPLLQNPNACHSHTCSGNAGLYYPTQDLLVFFLLRRLVYFSEANIPNSDIGTKAQVLSVLISWVTDLRSYDLIDNVSVKMLSVVPIA